MSRNSTKRWSNRTVEQKAAAYRELAKDPPCKSCEMPRSQHANDKCLFMPGDYIEPTHPSLRIFFRWGTYKHEGRVRQGRDR